MPARDMHFTFDKKVKINKKTVLEFVKEYEYYIREDFQNIKATFNVDEINVEFLKEFIKTMKSFSSESIDDEYINGKEEIVKNFIYGTIGNEKNEGDGVLGVRYLYDEWCYDGCGHDEHYYLTYIDDVKMAKKQ